jgi:hypothetical protein
MVASLTLVRYINATPYNPTNSNLVAQYLHFEGLKFPEDQ